MKYTSRTIARFWSKVDKRNNDECWEWTRAKGTNGYGCIQIDGKACSTHRVSYVIHNGAIPAGFHVLHSCHNPPCVNPAHLRTGTHQDNMRDRNAAEHHLRCGARGEENGSARLKGADVIAIRALYASGNYTHAKLGKMYDMSQVTIGEITRGKTWKHIPVEEKSA